jgi:hypothetical protein
MASVAVAKHREVLLSVAFSTRSTKKLTFNRAGRVACMTAQQSDTLSSGTLGVTFWLCLRAGCPPMA